MPAWTVSRLLAVSADYLASKESSSPRLDAELLLAHTLGVDRIDLYTEPERPLIGSELDGYRELVARRAAHEPVAYLVGRAHFRYLTLEVTPAVLIPRPESELIVEAALARFPDAAAPLTVADACTGSGCLAVALARERRRARLVATDLSPAALEVAARNAARHHAADRIRFVRTDVLDSERGPFDLIVCNPPYVPAPLRGALPPEVRDHEPGEALFAGEDGLAVVRTLLKQASTRLIAGAPLVFEFGFGQEDGVRAAVAAQPELELIEIRRDLQHIPRTAIVIRRL